MTICYLIIIILIIKQSCVLFCVSSGDDEDDISFAAVIQNDHKPHCSYIYLSCIFIALMEMYYIFQKNPYNTISRYFLSLLSEGSIASLKSESSVHQCSK